MDSKANARYNLNTDTLETLVTSTERNLFGDTITRQEWTPADNFPKLTKNYELLQNNISSVLEETKKQKQYQKESQEELLRYQKELQKEILDLKADNKKLQEILLNHISSVSEETEKQNHYRKQLLEEILELSHSCKKLKNKISTGNNI